MDDNGLIAFCTFYQGPICKNGETVLRFKVKNVEKYPDLKNVDVVLYPNSLVLIPLEMNRLFTHEIRPSNHPISKISTRMGYVIRSSNVFGVHKDGQTYVETSGGLIALNPPTLRGVRKLKRQYLDENLLTRKIDYEEFYFSVNEGDYMKPLS